MLKNFIALLGFCLIQTMVLGQVSGFEKNNGQIANAKGEIQSDVLFRTKQGNARVYFYKDHVSYYFYKKSDVSYLSQLDVESLSVKEYESVRNRDTVWVYRLDLDFVGSQTSKVIGQGKKSHHANYFLAHCSSGIENVPFYNEIIYKDVYPGVDYKFGFSEGGLKYDIFAGEGSNISQIKFRYNGHEGINLSSNQLDLNSPFGELTESLPASYKLGSFDNPFATGANIEGEELVMNYQIDENGVISFFADQEINGAILIDPRLVWSTYYNYDDGSVFGEEMHVGAGQVVSVSSTDDGIMPTLDPGGTAYYQGSLDTTGGILEPDLRILKFDTDGVLNWATYYGGTGPELVSGGVKINETTGQIYIAALSTSLDFPTQDLGGGAWYESTNNTAEQQIVILRFNGNGSRQWATYVNANISARPYDIDIAGNGDIYIVGSNNAGNTIATQTLVGGYNQATPAPNDPVDSDGLILSYDANGIFRWGTYYGNDNAGFTLDEEFKKVKVAPDGSIYAFGTVNASGTLLQDVGGYFDNTHNGGTDILAVRFSSSGVQEWSTYFGGSGNELDVYGIAADSSNNIYISGLTTSNDLPTMDPGGGAFFDNSINGVQSGFIAKFNSATNLVWSTYFGATDNDWRTTLDVSPNGKVYVAEYTSGTSGMPIMNKTNAFYETTGAGALNGFVAQFDTSGVQEWGTYVSSTGFTTYNSIRTYNGLCGDQVYVGGFQSAALYPVVDPGGGAYQQTYPGTGGPSYIISQFNDNLQNPGWTAPATLCGNSPAINLNTTITGDMGGTWSGPGITGTIFDPATVLQDTVDVTYTLGSGLCIDSLQQEIIINQPSTIPLNINASLDSICPGGSSTLTINGGSLGGGADWYWYEGLCGNNFISNGTSIVVSPTSTTTYYARAEGACNTTSCVAVTIHLKTESVPPTSLVATTNPTCIGDSTYLVPQGGSLGTGADWNFYQGSCGGTALGTGDSVFVFPTGITQYYVGAVGDCNTTFCASVSVTTANPSVDPTGISTLDTTICTGSFTTLNIVGGTLGTTADWQWYSGSCGGTPEGNGTSITVSPTTTTTYFARAEGYCGDGNCVQLTINVNTASTAAVSVSASVNPVCDGDSTVLTVNGGVLGNGADWYWYTGSCGGTPVDTGVTATVTPTGPTTYFVRAENLCNSTTCSQITINITPAGDASWVSPGTICESVGIVNLDNFITGNTGGTWSGTNVAGSTFNPAGLSGSSVTITYTQGTAPCEDVVSFVVNITSTVNAAWTNPGNICESNGLVDLDLLLTGSTGGSWSGTGVTGSIFDPSGLNGPVNIEYIVGVAPSCIDSSEQAVTVIPGPPVPTVTVTSTSICQGDTITISGSGSGTSVQYHVYDDAGTTNLLGDTDLDVSPAVTTTYYIIAEDHNGCFHSGGPVDVTVTVTPAPLADAGLDVTICDGGTANLTATGGTDYLWSTTETTASISVSPADDQWYFVTVTDNASMCSAIDSVLVSVIGAGDVIADDDHTTTGVATLTVVDVLANDVNGDPNTLVIISGPSGGNASVVSNEINYTSNEDFVGQDSIYYSICHATCTNVCDTGLLTIFVTSSLEAIVPTGFSPNGDGINDAFVVLGLENYPEAELSVFNRWGELVFHTLNYNNDWEGATNGKRVLSGDQVPDGTYFYVLKLGNSFETLHGSVEIKRK